MIAIINVSKEYKKRGKQMYLLKINESKILQFTHNAEDGLAVCLLKAALAYLKTIRKDK